jgi:pilus assembly protein CpaE
MPSSMTILVIDNNPDSIKTVEALQKQSGETVKIVSVVNSFAEGLSVIQKTTPMVVILHVDNLERGVMEIGYILSLFNRISIIVTAANETSEWVLGLMRAGAIEYLFHPLQLDALRDAIQKVGRIWHPVSESAKPQGQVITVYNPLGGMGTTTIAVNLAVCLANGGSKKVALIDLNLFSGDVATFLNINPTYTLSSVTKNISRVDSNFIMSVMTPHSSSMFVLTEPLEVDESSEITTEQLSHIISVLSEMFSHVVIDTGGYAAGCNKAVFEASDFILYNTVMNLPGLKNTRRYITSFEKSGLLKGRVKLLVNRYTPRADISIEDAEKVLDWKVFHTIPNEYRDVVESINKGVPLVTLFPRSSVSKAIVRLSELLK